MTKDLLSCVHSRAMWVSWDDGNIKLGQGQPFANPLIDWRDYEDNYPRISSLSIASGLSQRAVYAFKRENIKAVTTHTHSDPEFNQFWMSWSGYPHAMFDVQACGNALIALTPGIGNKYPLMYEIELGANSLGTIKSTIRNGTLGPVIAQADTPDILSCNERRTIWVSWFRQGVEVGIGA